MVAIGEVLWDVFPTGPRFGGAPANFACSAAGLSGTDAQVIMVSAVGKDALGDQARIALADHQVSTDYVFQFPQKTGQVLIDLDATGSASYEFASDCAWDNLAWSEELVPVAESTDVVCFGTLGQRDATSAATIRRFVSETPRSALRIFDINLRPPYFSDRIITESLKIANVLKLNDEELPVLTKLCGIDGDVESQLKRLRDLFQLKAIALTKGSEGATLLHGEQMHSCPGIKTQVADTVGAGDAFTAAFALGLLSNQPLPQINQRACEVAAYVCSQSGATPDFPVKFAGLI